MAYTVPYYHSTFPGEPYLQYTLPDYARERFYIVLRLLLAFFLFFVWLPRQFVFRSVITENYSNAINNGPKEEESGSVKNTMHGHSNGTAANGNSKKKKKRRDNKGNGGGAKSSCSMCSNENEPKESSEQQTQGGREPLAAVVEFDQTRSSILTLLGIIIIFFILFLSPNNTFPSRTLLRTPLFTREECDKLVELANEAAKRNAEIAKKDKKDLLKKFPGLSAVEKAVSSGSKNETEVRDVEGWRDLRRLNSMLKGERETTHQVWVDLWNNHFLQITNHRTYNSCAMTNLTCLCILIIYVMQISTGRLEKRSTHVLPNNRPEPCIRSLQHIRSRVARLHTRRTFISSDGTRLRCL